MTTTAAAQEVRLPFIPIVDIEPRSRGFGALEAVAPQGRLSLPLASVQISARVADRIAEVEISQRFVNPHKEPLEATYIFPLAGGAAVSRFELQVGGRIVKGLVQERGEARRTYEAALDAGRRAALLEQERDDVFTVQVGNLPPGEEVTVRLSYSERLPLFEDGTAELRLPLVVAPRYAGGAPLTRDPVGAGIGEDTTRVPDASRIAPPRLAPGFDPKVALLLEVSLLRAGPGAFEDLSCSQHALRTRSGPESVRVSLARNDEPLDRDFVLRWRLAGAEVKPSLLLHEEKEGAAFGVLTLLPPRRDGFLGLPRDVVFVIDRSGSMEGVKMTSAARACALLLATLGPRDRFAIEAFDNAPEWLDAPGALLPADEAGLEKGERFLRGIAARGGTELDLALREALSALQRQRVEGRAPIVVLLTDGQVGDESSVLRSLQMRLGEARVFSVGIDTAVNDGFLRRLAAAGGGTATLVEPGAQLEDALRAVGREIGTPLVIDLALEDIDCGLDAASLAPARIPDLFEGRAASVFVKVRRAGKLRLVGRLASGGRFEQVVEAGTVALPAIGQLWARTRVIDLEDRFRLAAASGETAEVESLRQQIVALAIAHTLLTRFTAFVAVDEKDVVNPGGNRRQVTQPVEMPARWEMQVQHLGAPALSLPAGAMAGGLPRPPAPQRTSAMAPGASMSHAKASGGRAFFTKKSASVEAPPPPPQSALEAEATPPMARDSVSGRVDYQTGEPPVPRADWNAVAKALEAWARALQKAETDCGAGKAPDAAALSAAREALLQALAMSLLGPALPALQRYLRVEAPLLIATLRRGGPVAAVRLLLDGQKPAFETARAEAAAAIAGVGGAASGPFWEATI